MSLRLRALELHIPGWVARSALRRLFEATASAFGRDPVDLRGLTQAELLERYGCLSVTRSQFCEPRPDGRRYYRERRRDVR